MRKEKNITNPLRPRFQIQQALLKAKHDLTDPDQTRMKYIHQSDVIGFDKTFAPF